MPGDKKSGTRKKTIIGCFDKACKVDTNRKRYSYSLKMSSCLGTSVFSKN